MVFKLAVTGGKGGTGKTVVAVNVASALSNQGFKVLLADADVDGPCVAALLNAKIKASIPVEIFKPVIDDKQCARCGKCASVCREHALMFIEGRGPLFFEELCSGCKACITVCNAGAIRSGRKTLGSIHDAEAGAVRVKVGELNPGEARSPLVARSLRLNVEEELRKERYDLLVFDTAPGVHNAVVQALGDVNLALAVTEPTPLGLHDLYLILNLPNDLGVEAWVVLNKANILGGMREKVIEACKSRGVKVAVEIPYDEELFSAYVKGQPLVKASVNTPGRSALLKLASKLKERIKQGS